MGFVLRRALGEVGGVIALVAFALVALLLFTETTLSDTATALGRFARGMRQQTLARAERKIVGQAERPGWLRPDDAAEFFEKRMGIDVAQRSGGRPVAVEPPLEGIEADLAACGHAQRLQKFAQAEKLGLLVGILVAVRVIERAG